MLIFFNYANCYVYHMFSNLCKNNASTLMLNDSKESGVLIHSYLRLNRHPIWAAGKNDCQLNVTTQSADGIIVCIIRVIFEKGCVGNESLNFVSNNQSRMFCESLTEASNNQSCYKFDDRQLQMTYTTSNGIPPRFKLAMNTFTNPPCDNTRFPCGNNRSCIWTGYMCDGINNCYDNTDEEENDNNFHCTYRRKWQWGLLWAGIVVVLLSLFCVLVFVISVLLPSPGTPTFITICDAGKCTNAVSSTSPEEIRREMFCDDCTTEKSAAVS